MKKAKTRMFLALSLGCMMLLTSCGSESSSSGASGGSGGGGSTATESWYVQYKGNEI